MAEGHPALWRRGAAYFLDSLWIGAYAAGLAAVAFALGAETVELSALAGQAMGLAVLTGPVVLAASAFESSRWRATPGKKALGLVVAPEAGDSADRLAFTAALLRNAGKFLPWELSHGAIWQMQPGGSPAVAFVLVLLTWTLVGLYVLGASRRAGRTLYDRLAGALIRLRPMPAAGSPT